MILVIEDRRTLDAAVPVAPVPAGGSLQRTLRRMGFHAARLPVRKPRRVEISPTVETEAGTAVIAPKRPLPDERPV